LYIECKEHADPLLLLPQATISQRVQRGERNSLERGRSLSRGDATRILAILRRAYTAEDVNIMELLPSSKLAKAALTVYKEVTAGCQTLTPDLSP